MGGWSWRDSIKVSYNKSELFDVQRMLETQSDIMPIYDKYPQLMTYKFTNLKLDFAEYIIHIHNNKLLNSWLLVKEIKDYIDVNNILKSSKDELCRRNLTIFNRWEQGLWPYLSCVQVKELESYGNPRVWEDYIWCRVNCY